MTPARRSVPAILTILICTLVTFGACQPDSQSAGSSRHQDLTETASADAIASLSFSMAQGLTRTETPPILPTIGQNISARATGLAYITDSDGRLVVDDQAHLALDGDPETIWNSSRVAPQWYAIVLDKPYLIESVEMLVTQSPPGPTTHELWIKNPSGVRTGFRTISSGHTEDGQTLVVRAKPPILADELLILTTYSPSWVAWRELRVFGTQPPVSYASESAQPLQVRKVAAGLNFPVQVTHAGDGSGRIFVVEQQGRILTLESGTVSALPFLDISEKVSCCRERGMFNVAFSPFYAENRTLYVSYSNLEGHNVFGRFTAGGNSERVELGSEEIVLVLPQPGSIHKGGQLAFGPRDGFLYIGSGDGGHWHQNKAQYPESLLGKILRIDVADTQQPYSIPPSNPYSSVDAFRDEIWALGLRNPWGIEFNKTTGDLFIPDTGNTKREEVNHQHAASKGARTTDGSSEKALSASNCGNANWSLPIFVPLWQNTILRTAAPSWAASSIATAAAATSRDSLSLPTSVAAASGA